MTLTLTAEEHASIAAPVPKGWKAERFGDANQYKRAIDPDGCRWYWEGGWILNVPWFRGRAGTDEQLAVVDHIDGELVCEMTKSGTIKIGTRRITSRNWNH